MMRGRMEHRAIHSADNCAVPEMHDEEGYDSHCAHVRHEHSRSGHLLGDEGMDRRHDREHQAGDQRVHQTQKGSGARTCAVDEVFETP